jgi:hypothetical protein
VADSNVPITAGSGTLIDSRTNTAGEHRQVVVLGDGAATSDAVITSTAAASKQGLDVNLVASAGGIAATTGTLTAVAGTVSAAIGSMGNGTIVLSGGTYTALNIAFEASVDAGTNWFPIDVVRADGTAVINGQVGEQFAATGIRAWNFMSPGYTNVRVRAVAITQTAAPTITITQGPFLYDPSPSVAPIDSNRFTYSATLNSTSVAAAVTTSVPVWEIVNPTASGKLVRVSRLAWELTLATAGTVPLIILQKRTAASTVGTAVTQAATTHDSLNPAASATVKYYTAAPTLAGAGNRCLRYSADDHRFNRMD